jgi:flagellar basal-body rod protein FlgB
VVSRNSLLPLEKTLAFTEARQRVLAENVANADTPGFVPRRVDTAGFQQALRQEIDAAEVRGTFSLKDGPGFRIDAFGRLQVIPEAEPVDLFVAEQDKPRIEEQMAMMAENAMMHQTVAELLRGRFEGLLKAIKGSM